MSKIVNDPIFRLIANGAVLCAETVPSAHGFSYFLEPSGKAVPIRTARRLIASGVVTRTTPGLLACCPGMTWCRSHNNANQ